MNTSNGAWERTAIIFLAVFAVGVVTASMEDPSSSSRPQSVDNVGSSPPGELGYEQVN